MASPDFQSIWQQAFGDTGRTVREAAQIAEGLRRALPNDSDYEAFWEWSRQKSRNSLNKALNPAITAEELVRTIDTDRLLAPSLYESLIQKMLHSTLPWIPMSSNPELTLLYRLVPDPFGLQPHDIDPPATNHQVLPLCFLGMNETVQPRQPALPVSRRKANLSRHRRPQPNPTMIRLASTSSR
jgi:hypothetical protein